ncbi:hypothetical protein [Erwinia persicina]|uniref:hypothetical protein n=1 Tax=Erwinia persicina TaxID=55211 RepID=UPI00177CC14B|nr:hypothetical protein [Erwinia persicina]MBD8216263.1 hypothetical protein [Erwinia persicina]
MKKFIASRIYITRYTCSSLSVNNTFDDIVALTDTLKSIVSDYSYSRNIHVECAKDFLDYKSPSDVLSLEEIIFQIAQEDLSIFTHYYDMFEKAISNVKSNIASSFYEDSLSGVIPKTFPRLYPLTIDGIPWPGKSIDIHTSNWKDTLKKNSMFIAENNKNKEEFINWSKDNYDNIVFHKDIKDTLDSIIQGTYQDYKFIISDSLNALNQCYHFISKDPNKNQEDLNFISSYTSNIGKQLACTRQGSNKPMFSFPIDDAEGNELVNCEYHLKINWDDSGRRLQSVNLVRIYFALKFHEPTGRKKIKVASIGKHFGRGNR